MVEETGSKLREIVKLNGDTFDNETGSFDQTDAIIENELVLWSALSQHPVFIATEADQFEIQPAGRTILPRVRGLRLLPVRLSFLGKNKFLPRWKGVTTLPTVFEARLSCH